MNFDPFSPLPAPSPFLSAAWLARFGFASAEEHMVEHNAQWSNGTAAERDAWAQRFFYDDAAAMVRNLRAAARGR